MFLHHNFITRWLPEEKISKEDDVKVKILYRSALLNTLTYSLGFRLNSHLVFSRHMGTGV